MKITTAIFLLGIGTLTNAETLPVIAMTGETVPTEPYLNAANFFPVSDAIAATSPSILHQLSQAPAHFSLSIPLPKTTMTVGTVSPHSVDLPWLSTPVFLIGNDPVSIKWLADHYHDLVTMHAQGLLIQEDSESDIVHIREQAPDLLILPVSGSIIATRLALQHYPVLITKAQVLQ